MNTEILHNAALRNAQECFMEAMTAGYAATETPKKTTIAELPGSKVITFDHGDWKLVDCYFVNFASNKSAGQTTIWWKGSPIWLMCYGGQYAKSAIPFLKKCLKRAYDTGHFIGGRGPEFMQDEQFTYVNRAHGTFSNFKGEERIYDRSETRFGHHWYHGMSLLK